MIIKMKMTLTALLSAFVLFTALPALASLELKKAQVALSAGKYNEALKLVVPVWKIYPLDAALLTSRAALELQRYALSEETARVAIELDKDNFAAHILLGNALYRQDKITDANLTLRRALDFAKDGRQKRLARGLLRQITDQQKFRFNGTFGLIPSSNVNKVTSEEKLDLIFGAADITSEKPKTGIGVFGGLNAIYTHPLPGNVKYSFTLNSFIRNYEDTDYNSDNRGYTTGVFMPLSKRSSANISYSYSRFTYGGDPYSDTRTLAYTYQYVFNNKKNLSVKLSHVRRDIHDKPFQLSYENTYSVSYDVWRSNQAKIAVELRHSRQLSDSSANDNWGKGISILTTYNPQSTAWLIDGALSHNYRSWYKRTGLFENAREDFEWIASLGVRNSDLSYYGLTPTLRYTFQDKNSNVQLYSVRSNDLFLGVSNAF